MTSALTVRNILFATDFSEASRPAGQTAAALADHFGARLHVLHVVPPVTDPTPAPEALRAVVADLEAGLSVVTAVASGRVAPQIVDYARRNSVDLVVLGTHGRTGVSRALARERRRGRHPPGALSGAHGASHAAARRGRRRADRGGRGDHLLRSLRRVEPGRSHLRGVSSEDPR
jgi:universal stress protein A